MNETGNWSRQFRPPGLSGVTVSPMNVEQQQPQDLPPGAPPYAGGPLANMPPRPPSSPTPAPQSLSTLAAGGFNHAQLWQSGQVAPQPQANQQSFAGPANPAPPQLNPDMLKRFSWSSAFDQAPVY